jgi:N6-L-threonylcarbamoyladenine synthase
MLALIVTNELILSKIKQVLQRKPRKHPLILAIESSCDDTSVAILSGREMLCNITATQIEHTAFGGVIPELASRVHENSLLPTVQQALDVSGISLQSIDAVACTRGPGLMGSLLVGLTFAKSLSLALRVPLIEVNHMQAHVLAHFIEAPYPPFPFICLTVSGGHTQIVLVHSTEEMEILGTTIDDAAGEAFDKIGKMLGLPYPAGPHIDKLAQTGKPVFSFPLSKIGTFDFSFSGLKTAMLYFLKQRMESDAQFIENNKANLAASAQHAIIENLMYPFLKAAKEYNIKHLALAGGVSANSGLRNRLETEIAKLGGQAYIPAFQYCTDNAGMIAVAAYFQYCKGNFSSLDISPLSRWRF